MIPKNVSRDEQVAWATLASLRLPIRPQRVLEVFGGPLPLFQNPSTDQLAALDWKPLYLQKLQQARLEPIAAAFQRLEARGVSILGFSDERYPRRLKEISCPPAALWVRGDPACLAEPMLAVVGSRQASPYGLSVTRVLSAALVRAGLGILSGGAVGIDALSHETALGLQGRSVAVFGTGIDVEYPSVHRALFERLSATGACVSEFAPGTPPRPEHFPIRNRLISGLSLGVVVVEAGEKSGGLITARFALEQNREVFAIPGPLDNPLSVGPNRLIQQGARLVLGVEDILGELRLSLRADELPMGARMPSGEGAGVARSSSRRSPQAPASNATRRSTPPVSRATVQVNSPQGTLLLESPGNQESTAHSSRSPRANPMASQRAEPSAPDAVPRQPEPLELPGALVESAEQVHRLLERLQAGPVGMAMLLDESAASPAGLSELLLELELAGLVQQLPGQRYQLPPRQPSPR